MKKILFVLLTLLLSACGSKLDGTYSNNMTGVAEQKMSFTFKPDGTSNMSIGSTAIPLEMPYEVSGNKIKVAGQNGDIIFTVLDNGDLITEGMRLTKETTSKQIPAVVETQVQTPKSTPIASPPMQVQTTPDTTSQTNSVEQGGLCNGLDLAVTSEQLECINKKFTGTDKELNVIYKQLMAGFNDDRKSALKKEQLGWIKEKETKCAQAGKEFEGGTMETVVIADCKLQITEQRIAYLKNYK